MGILDGLVGLRAYLDANFFIYLAEGFAPVSAAVARLAAMIGAGELAAFTSELTLAETLVVPHRKGDLALIRLDTDLVSSRDGLTVVPVTRTIWLGAAAERASGPFKLPDAVPIATARQSACDAFLTNDRGFARLSGLAVHYLDDPALM
jgi:predicted nucleic acid-binding protein